MNNTPSLSFVLPMFNESENIRTTIQEIKSLAQEITDAYEIIVVDDASTDGCGDIVEDMAHQDNHVRFFRLLRNTKFGGALSEGLRRVVYDYAMYMDSDMPVSAEDIKKSLLFIAHADIVTAYSTIRKGDTLKRKIMSSVYNFMVRTLFGIDIKDINSGYKIIRGDFLKKIKLISNSPFVDVELFLYAKRHNLKIHQYPLIFRSRSGGTSHIARPSVVLATLIDMFRIKYLSLWFSV